MKGTTAHLHFTGHCRAAMALYRFKALSKGGKVTAPPSDKGLRPAGSEAPLAPPWYFAVLLGSLAWGFAAGLASKTMIP